MDLDESLRGTPYEGSGFALRYQVGLLFYCQAIEVCDTNMRDHDFGKELKNGKHSNFPYTFPDQVV